MSRLKMLHLKILKLNYRSGTNTGSSFKDGKESIRERIKLKFKMIKLKFNFEFRYCKYLIKIFIGNFCSLWHPSAWVEVASEEELNNVVKKEMEDCHHINCCDLKFPTGVLIGRDNWNDFRKINIKYNDYMKS